MSLQSRILRAGLLLTLLGGGCSDSRKPGEGDGDPDQDFDNAGGDSTGSSDDSSGSSDDGASGASGGGGSGSGGSLPPGAVPPSSLPTFPGAGTSDAGDPLPGGMLCDSVAGDEPLIPEPIGQCFVDKNDPKTVAATLEQVLECVDGTDTVHVRLTLHPWFVDNTYGANAIGWPMRRGHCNGHCWTDLTKSDHAEIILTNGAGEIVLRFKLDYITEDPSSPSGYSSLGVTGGDGAVLVGDASAVVKWSTSQDRNLNERGYDGYTVDSPATDESFTPNPDAPDWDYRVVYEAWIDADIFGDAGFGGASIEYVHASPAKSMSDTIEVMPGECPPCPDNDPDSNCSPDDPPPDEPPGCVDNDPDTFCGEGGTGGGGSGGSGSGGTGSGGSGGDPLYCQDHPDDPACRVD